MDISEHQGHISNWEGIIKDNDIDAVIVRIGYSGAEDKHLAHNISELNRLGVPYGIYLYTYASTEADGVEDAEQTIALIKKIHIKTNLPYLLRLRRLALYTRCKISTNGYHYLGENLESVS